MWRVAWRWRPDGVIDRARSADGSDMRITSKHGNCASPLLSGCIGTAACVSEAHIAVDKDAQNDHGVERLAEMRTRLRYQRPVVGYALSNARGELHDRVSHAQDIRHITSDMCKITGDDARGVVQRGNSRHDRVVR